MHIEVILRKTLESTQMKQPEKERPGPQPQKNVTDAAIAVIDHGWTGYRAAKYFGCSTTAVYNRVKIINEATAKMPREAS